MNNAWHIQKVILEDADEWVSLALRLWPEYSAGEIRPILLGILASPHQEAFLVRDATNTAIAFINLSLRRDYVPGATTSPVAYLEGIYVEERYRKQGLARWLMSQAEIWAREQNCIELASDVLLDNHESQKFHNKVGFREVERVVAYIKPVKAIE